MKNIEGKLLNYTFVVILVVNLSHQMGQQMMNTLIPKYVDSLGTSAYIVGLVTSVAAFSSLLLRPITTPALDSFNKKRLLTITMFGILAVFVSYSLAKSIPVIIITRLVHGICIGAEPPLSLAILSNSLPNNKLGKGIGIFSLCQAAGQAVGPGFGLSISSTIGYQYTFLIGAAVIAIGFGACFFLKEQSDEKDPYKITLDKIIDKDAIHSGVILFFLAMSYCCISTFIAIYSGLRGIENIGLYFTVYAIFLFATRPLSGILIDKFGYAKVLVPGILFFGLSFFIISISTTITDFMIAGAVAAFGYGVCYPTIQSLSICSARKGRRGSASSTGFLGMDFGMLLGPTLAGGIIDSLMKVTGTEVQAYSSMYVIMIIPMFFSLAYFLIVRKRINASIKRNNPMSLIDYVEPEAIG